MPEIRFTLERHPFCHHPASTYYVLGAGPEVKYVKANAAPLLPRVMEENQVTPHFRALREGRSYDLASYHIREQRGLS